MTYWLMSILVMFLYPSSNICSVMIPFPQPTFKIFDYLLMNLQYLWKMDLSWSYSRSQSKVFPFSIRYLASQYYFVPYSFIEWITFN
jgi:hypothetical protein